MKEMTCHGALSLLKAHEALDNKFISLCMHGHLGAYTQVSYGVLYVSVIQVNYTGFADVH